MKALLNKKGDSYIYLCIIVLFISLLLSVLILYMGLTAEVQIQKREAQRKLDSYIASYSTKVFDALKQGESYEKYINWSELESGALPALGFESQDDDYVYANGNCTLTEPVVTILKGEGFGITVYYIANYPVQWGGKTYTDLSIPITVTSYYKTK